jgi:hypothetical protein
MAMRGVDSQHIGAIAYELGRALQKVSRRSDRSAHTQAALLVLAGVGIFQLLLDVLDRDQALSTRIDR